MRLNNKQPLGLVVRTWMTDAILQYKHTTFNLVGAPSSAVAIKVRCCLRLLWLLVLLWLTMAWLKGLLRCGVLARL